ncbi:MAG: hypothetical protein REI11_15420, partial [Patulibacter sp.]|nr:hypothetical protein [Patulibacter sp.]
MPAPLSRPLVALAVLAVAAVTLSACGAGPREPSRNSIDAMFLTRGVLAGKGGDDQNPGVRALNAREPKTIARFQTDLPNNLFGTGGKTKLSPYLNGLAPAGGENEIAYPGDRIGWLVRDPSDAAKLPSAIVGLFPAPFDSRFSEKRRMSLTRIQCAQPTSAECTDTSKSFEAEGLNAATSNLEDEGSGPLVNRVFVGSWAELQPALTGNRLKPYVTVQQNAESNGYGFEVAADGKSVRIAAPFGKAAPDVSTYGPGTGV